MGLGSAAYTDVNDYDAAGAAAEALSNAKEYPYNFLMWQNVIQ